MFTVPINHIALHFFTQKTLEQVLKGYWKEVHNEQILCGLFAFNVSDDTKHFLIQANEIYANVTLFVALKV